MRHLHCIFSLITSLWDQTTNPADTNPNFFLTKIICYWLHLCNIKCKWITCSPHWTLQNIQIPILQIFVFVCWRGTRKHFHWSKIFFGPMKMFSCPPFNKQKQRFGELEFEFLEGPMSWTSYCKWFLEIFRRLSRVHSGSVWVNW